MKNLTLSHPLIYSFLVAGVLGIQLWGIHRPLAGHFGSYQQVMGGMAKNMLRENFSQPFLPKTDILVAGERGLHLNQYPFPSVISALLTRTAGQSVEFWGRLQAILFNILSILLIGFIGVRLFDKPTGLIAAVIYGFSPFSMIYGQMFFSEPMAVFCLLLAVWFFLGGLEDAGFRSNMKILCSAVFFSLSVTGRIHMILFLPVFLILLLDRNKFLKSFLRILFFTGVSLALPLLWYGFTYFVSMQSTHVLTNIFSQTSTRKIGDGNFLLNMAYYSHVFDIFATTMLTPLGFSAFVIGLITLIESNRRVFFLIAGSLLFGSATIVLSPQKIMAHEFYLAGVFPFVALTAAYAAAQASAKIRTLQRPWVAAFIMFFYLAVSARYFFHPLFSIPADVYKAKTAAASLQKVSAPADQVIVAGESTASMVYYSDRPVWVMQFSELGKPLAYYRHDARFTKRSASDIATEEAAMQNAVTWLEYFKKQGARFFAASDRSEADRYQELMTHLRTHYCLVSGPMDPFYIFDLSQTCGAVS